MPPVPHDHDSIFDMSPLKVAGDLSGGIKRPMCRSVRLEERFEVGLNRRS